MIDTHITKVFESLYTIYILDIWTIDYDKKKLTISVG